MACSGTALAFSDKRVGTSGMMMISIAGEIQELREQLATEPFHPQRISQSLWIKIVLPCM
jgi:hypothetical protein